jgi:ABC-type branched-subunit amino acid transport system ATPase component
VQSYRQPPFMADWFGYPVVDRWHTHHMMGPGLTRVELRCAPPGKLGVASEERGYVIHHSHTPIDGTNHTWRLWVSTRSKDLTRRIAETFPTVMDEDRWALERQQRNFEYPDDGYHEVYLRSDKALLRCRKILEEMERGNRGQAVPVAVHKAAYKKAPVLQASRVVKSFGGFHALAGCSLEIARGSITGIIGPNGAGKSTLFNVLGGLLAPESGDVTFEGHSILSLRPDQRARIGLVRTFQISRELGELTVLENMLLATPKQQGESVWRALFMPGRVRAEERAAVAKARTLLGQVDLWPLADEPAKNLSGGQKKLLEISRALMLEPKIMLLDEPTAGVSPVMTEALAQTILKLRNQGLTFAIIEHDMDVIAQLCAPIFVLAEGRTLMRGTFSEVASNGEVMSAYLGKAA